MPVWSDIQERLRRHEQWLIGLRQDPAMTTAKIQTKLENEKGLKATYVILTVQHYPVLLTLVPQCEPIGDILPPLGAAQEPLTA